MNPTFSRNFIDTVILLVCESSTSREVMYTLKCSKTRYLVTTVINQNYIQEGIKSRLNLGTACCYFGMFCLLVFYLKIKVFCCYLWVWYLVKVSHHHHICNVWLTNSILCIICRRVYGLLHTKSHVPSSGSVLVITIKLEAQEYFCVVTIFCYSFQKYYLNKSYIYFSFLLSSIISGPCVKWCWYHYHLTNLCVCHVITECGKLKVQVLGALQLHVIQNLIKIDPAFLKLKHTYDHRSYKFMHM
jgi:hypothetical protein